MKISCEVVFDIIWHFNISGVQSKYKKVVMEHY